MGQQENITATVKSAPTPDDATDATGTAEIAPKMALASTQPIQMGLSALIREEAECGPVNGVLGGESIQAPRIAPDGTEGNSAPVGSSSEMPTDSAPASEPAAENPSPRVNRFTLLAACLALSAALGGMVGALVAFSITRPQALAEAKLTPEEIQVLKENVVQARVELAALKASLDAGNRGSSIQLTKIAERVERIERSASEPAAKLTKAAETLERLVRSEMTGAIIPPQAIGGGSGKIDGWILRDVRRGVAFLEGRAGVIEVEQGDVVPGLGRVDAIRKQDGRWVVITAKGIISAPAR